MFPISDSIRAKGFPILNILIIAFTVFIFIKEITAPSFEAFINMYALIPSQVTLGDIATLFPFISAIFLHGGFLHIISNMWFLWIFGDNVEGHTGWFFFPFLYLVSGIIGNVVQYLFMSSSNIPMLGASGAVAGVLGAYYVLFPYSKIKTLVIFFGFITFLELSAPFMLGYWFILQIVSGFISLPVSAETGGIAFFAHAAGFITGMILAKMAK